jgi:hypothetical protein
MHYPFTLFNCITAAVLIATLLMFRHRFAGDFRANWPLGYYAAVGSYSAGFAGSLNPFWVAAGAACAVVIRLGVYPRGVRFAELLPLAYVAWRCVALLLMW